ncbi:hypothetical protein QFZ54_001429 [Sphingomonas faeni]|nr:hypothetical protein [Sphingomonas faeni]
MVSGRRVRKVIDKADWDSLQTRVEANTDAVLALFAERDTEATFFALRLPAMAGITSASSR